MPTLKLSQKIALILLPFVVIGMASVYQNARASEAYAVNPITVTYDEDSPTDPMFEVTNMLPGDVIEKEFKVKNTGHATVNVEMYGSLTNVLKNFDEILTIEIIELPATSVFAGTLEDFLDHTPFDLGGFAPNAEKTYSVKVKFPSSAGNVYQNAKVVFDIIWQAKFKTDPELPLECSHLEGKIKHVIRGNEHNNYLFGTHHNDLIIGFGGNDHINGKGGDDCIVGNEGNDKLVGGSGMDVLLGGAGNDELFGGTNNDFLDGGPDHDFLKGESGTDTCVGGEAVHSSCEL